MKFGYTILYVEDVREAVAFYETAFGIQPKFVHESGDFAELDTGATALAFCSFQLLRQMGKTPKGPDRDAPCFEIAFTTDDVAGAVARAVEAGAELKRAPEVMPWGQTVAYVTDGNGFLVEICAPVG